MKQRNINNLKALTLPYRIRIYYHLQSSGTLLLTVDFIILGAESRFVLWFTQLNRERCFAHLTSLFFPFYLCTMSAFGISVHFLYLQYFLWSQTQKDHMEGCIIMYRCSSLQTIPFLNSQNRVLNNRFQAENYPNWNTGKYSSDCFLEMLIEKWRYVFKTRL